MKHIHGNAYIMFIEDETELFEDKIDNICEEIERKYQNCVYSCWHNYVWNAILIDFDNSKQISNAANIKQEYYKIQLPSPDLAIITRHIHKFIEDNIPSFIENAGYINYCYTQVL